MSRVIKFRIWDAEQKIMFYPDGNLTPSNPEISHGFNWRSKGIEDNSIVGFPQQNWFSEDVTVQQFTGLKDKNGKEIFEGDILYFLNKNGVHEKSHRLTVTWNDSKARFELNTFDFAPLYEYEVVGNIFEGQDL